MKYSTLLIFSLCVLTSCEWPKHYITKNDNNHYTELKLMSDSTFNEICTRRGVELKYQGTWMGNINLDDTIYLQINHVNGNPISESINRQVIIKPDSLIVLESLPWDY